MNVPIDPPAAPSPDDGLPYRQVVVEGDWLFVAGQLAADEPGWQGTPGDIEAETDMVMRRLLRLLAAHGAGPADIVRVGVFMTDLAGFARMNAVYRRHLDPQRLPARTCVGVASLLSGGCIEIDCVARRPRAA
jgi:2-iminobutanoate/2-iminopropanoate deaminase